MFAPDDIAGATGTLEVSERTFNALHYGRSPRLVEVDTISLDEFFGDSFPPAVIKIDVEGAELRVLQGAAMLIGEYRPVLFLEVFSRCQQIFDFLRQHNYFFDDSDRRQHVSDKTTNIVAYVPDRSAAMGTALVYLGYPIAP